MALYSWFDKRKKGELVSKFSSKANTDDANETGYTMWPVATVNSWSPSKVKASYQVEFQSNQLEGKLSTKRHKTSVLKPKKIMI